MNDTILSAVTDRINERYKRTMLAESNLNANIVHVIYGFHNHAVFGNTGFPAFDIGIVDNYLCIYRFAASFGPEFDLVRLDLNDPALFNKLDDLLDRLVEMAQKVFGPPTRTKTSLVTRIGDAIKRNKLSD